MQNKNSDDNIGDADEMRPIAHCVRSSKVSKVSIDSSLQFNIQVANQISVSENMI